MKKVFLFFTSLLFVMSSYGTCNWASVISSKHFHKNQQLHYYSANVFFQDGKGYFIDASWTINGRLVSSSPYLSTYFSHNGTYLLSLKLHDRIYNCDTTFYDTLVLSSIPTCNWVRAGLSVNDHCDLKDFRTGFLGFANFQNNALDLNFYKYEWSLNGNPINGSDTSTLFIPASPTGSYNICVKITDTVNNCDTTICVTKLKNCPAVDSFPGWSYAFDSFSQKQHCRNPWFYSAIEAAVYLKPRMNNYHYWISWSVNGIEQKPSVANGYGIAYQPPMPGTYQVCAHIRDSLAHKDTTICRSITYTCDLSCQWSPQTVNLYSYDTCYSDSTPVFVFAGVQSQPNLRSFFKYDWKVDGVSEPLYNYSRNFSFSRYIGNYNLCVTVTDTLNNCDTTLCKVITINCGGLGLKSLKNGSLKLYPNPASGSFTLESQSTGNLKLIDLTGRVRMELEVLKGLQSIDISGLENGVYFIQVVSPSGVLTSKLMKE